MTTDGSAFHRAVGDALDEVFLEDQDHDDLPHTLLVEAVKEG